jgi:hypothetical protein
VGFFVVCPPQTGVGLLLELPPGILCPHPAKRIMRIRRRAIAPAQRMELINEYLMNRIFMPLSR